MRDALIIGGGHNGLVAAAYLARAGLAVTVLERRGVVGGAAVTEEFAPGFRNSVAAYTVSLLQPKVIGDLDLAGHGLRIVPRLAQNFLPTLEGRSLLVQDGLTEAGRPALNARDAASFDAFSADLQAVADRLRALVLRPPPHLVPGALWRNAPAALEGLRAAKSLAGLSAAQMRLAYDLFTDSAGHLLDARFENDLLKALLGFDAIVGNFASPYETGTGYVMLHHAFGEVNGVRGRWGHAIGGMGAITQAMARAAAAAGAEIETRAGVREVIVEGGRAAGVVLEDGRALRTRVVIGNVNPKLLFGTLVPAEALPAEFLRRMQNWRCGSGTFRMNVALSALPRFSARPEAGPHLTSGIILAPSLGYMDAAYRDARAFGESRAPVIELLIPSTLDDTLAPRGAHVASLFCQHVAPERPDGESWDAHKERVADLMIATVDAYAPGFAQSVVARQVLSPLDLEREFGLLGGDIFHGALSLNQLYAARPALGFADYRSPLPGLYLCGSGAHPGGGVTGAPGHNAAQAVLADFRHRRKRG